VSREGNREKDKKRQDLQTMPGIGPSLARDLRDLGVRRVGDMAGKSPEELYQRLCRMRKRLQDPCLLYAFRCAKYYALRKSHDSKLLLWWNWKGRPSP
jgi:nucleotidyltransferase/DNA polymerase involved in DNA repair